ncbi:MAG: hypothetical protein IPF63_15760 [Bacteroidetes bacterium]|nr:hypothetical protein [Bacteroidota bacterium]
MRIILFILAISSFFFFTSCSLAVVEAKIVRKTDLLQKGKEITKIVSISPEVSYFKKGNTFSENMTQGAELKTLFNNSLKYCADKNKVKLTIIDQNKIDKEDEIYYNRLKPLKDQILIAYMNQTMNPYKSALFKRKIHSSNTQKISPDFQDLIKKYGTKYFATQGIISVKKKLGKKGLFYLIAPLKAINGNYITFFYSLVADIETGEIIYVEERLIDNKPSQTYLENIIYNSFFQLKTKKK